VTEETPRAPEGWYADPEQAGYLRWWDGYRWTLRKPVPLAPRATEIGSGFARLSSALGVLLVLDLMVCAARVALYGWGVTAVLDAVEAGDVGTATSFDDLDRIFGVVQIVGILVTGVVWMVWQFRLARATQGLARTPALHAFSWIIPIAVLWMPFQNVRDLWARVVPARRALLLGWWWAGWLATEVVGRFASGARDGVDSRGELRAVLWTSLVTVSVGLATAILAVRIVRTLARGSMTSPFVNRVE
jgi:hypothetical protein